MPVLQLPGDENVAPASSPAVHHVLDEGHAAASLPLSPLSALNGPERTPRKQLGHAVRVPVDASPGPSAAAAATCTPQRPVGSVTALGLCKTPKSVAAALGSDVAVTPVRRSARLGATSSTALPDLPTAAGADAALKLSNYAFVPNTALLASQPAASEMSLEADEEAVEEGHNDGLSTAAVEDVAIRRVSAVLLRRQQSNSSNGSSSASDIMSAAAAMASPKAKAPGQGLLYLHTDTTDEEEEEVDVVPPVVRPSGGSPLVLNRHRGEARDDGDLSADDEGEDQERVSMGMPAPPRCLRFSAAAGSIPAATAAEALDASAAVGVDGDGEVSPLSVFARVMAGLLTATIAAKTTETQANVQDDAAPCVIVEVDNTEGTGMELRRGRSAVKSPVPARRRSSRGSAVGRPPRRSTTQ